MTKLANLAVFNFSATRLCVPDDQGFVSWLQSVGSVTGSGLDCGAISGDRGVLEALYYATDGPNWTNSANWTTDLPLQQWHGVTVDSEGRVSELHLQENNLSGQLLPEIGALGSLEWLHLGGNNLTGPIPPEIGDLASLTQLYLWGNGFSGPVPNSFVQLQRLVVFSVDPINCVPATAAFTAWLQRFTVLVSGTIRCHPDAGALVALYEATDGPNWTNDEKWWLTVAPLGEWYGVTVDDEGRVIGLDLEDNNLSGPLPAELGQLDKLEELILQDSITGTIPPELGKLGNLKVISLVSNSLTGPIPREFGDLTSLKSLGIGGSPLTGSIPPELGNLANLETLVLSSTDISGTIPLELGNLGNLTLLILAENNLSGAIPANLGNLTKLEALSLEGNDLSGSVPPELGNLASLEALFLHDNAELIGAFPETFLQLTRLEALTAHGTQLCIPSDPAMLAWLRSLEASGRLCVVRMAVLPPSNGQRALIGAQLPQPVVVQAIGVNDEPVEGATVVFVPEEGHGTANPSEVSTAEGGIAETFWTLGQMVGEQTLLAVGPEGRSVEVTAVATLPSAEVATLEIVWGNRQSGNAAAELHQRMIVRALDSVGAPVEGATVVFQPGEGHGAVNPSEAVTRENGWAVGAWTLGLGDIEQTLTATTGDVSVQFQATARYSERMALEAFYHATGGPAWTNRQNWLTDASLDQWFGVSTDEGGGVLSVVLANNGLSGRIPPAAGTLRKLQTLILDNNDITGSIPPELGRLDNLELLGLNNNRLSGEIPPEFGDLSSLRTLRVGSNELVGHIPVELTNLFDLRGLVLFGNRLRGRIPGRIWLMDELTLLNLADNQLEGSVPQSLGELVDLKWLILSDNDLAGPLPEELGQLRSLEGLLLGNNHFSGSVPERLSNLRQLRHLELHNNSGLTGTLSTYFVSLNRLERLRADGTGICLPQLQTLSRMVRQWVESISDLRLRLCGEGQALAYLTQAIQNPRQPVPLIAGKDALLRVFMTTIMAGTQQTIPPVRAEFFVDGQRVYETTTEAGSGRLQPNLLNGELNATANATIPGHVIQPGLEMVVNIDPEGTLEPTLGVPGRFPVIGRTGVEVAPVKPLRIVLVPFVYTPTNNQVGLTLAKEFVDNPWHHQLDHLNHLLPVGHLTFQHWGPIETDSRDAYHLLSVVKFVSAYVSGSAHHRTHVMGLTGFGITPTGLGERPGRRSISAAGGSTMAHELGHNFNLQHAPCGNPDYVDPNYPSSDGSIGDRGYQPQTDFWEEKIILGTTKDLMSYCSPKWISAYSFTKALRYRQATDSRFPWTGIPALATKSLLVWGGVAADGTPYLDPAFVVNAPPILPETGGPFQLQGRRTNGSELFSLAFDMPELADGDGRSAFVFALPMQNDWESELASLVLSGPRGTVEMQEGSEPPMVMATDPVSGEIRAILRNVPDLAGNALAESLGLDARVGGNAGESAPRLDIMISRGLPGARDWRR